LTAVEPKSGRLNSHPPNRLVERPQPVAEDGLDGDQRVPGGVLNAELVELLQVGVA
jgi:hypothetical protein